MYYLALLVVAVIAYLIGSLNSAIISVHLVKRQDIRDYGSHNAGLTNVYRTFGGLSAAMTLIIDVLKGIAVVFGTRAALFWSGLFSAEEHSVITACMLASMFAVMGHCFPIFYGFKGGKGILIAAVCTICINPLVFLLAVIAFLIIFLATRYVSLSSITCCVYYPICYILADLIMYGKLDMYTAVHAVIALIMGIFCLVRHMPNIQRLRNHTESKFTFRKRGDSK
ncbi:MAG: glycerol-3-phosphate 1-O-acyltransferase PlsY [Oscillospiraceae bacterium]|nr:glycerol-3-phosphate 1-O-acyltransferase PlsY [Oscillospiraceae bacterium]